MLLDLNPYGGDSPDGMFPLFYKQVAHELAPKLAVIFRHLVRKDSFPKCWKWPDVVLVPKESSFSDVEGYIPISITPVLSNVLERIVAGNLSNFKGKKLLSSQVYYRKGLGTCDALLTLSHDLQAALDGGM